MVNILMVIPNQSDATSFYRAVGPFAELRRKKDINLIFTPQIDWATMDMVDFVFVQRPFRPEHLAVMELAQSWNVPVWVDYDDLLFDVPVDNPAYEHFMNKETIDRVIKCIMKANLVTVSTHMLKQCFQLKEHPLSHNVHVIPNALNDRMLRYARPYSRNTLVNWRGTNTHQADLVEYGAEMVEFSKENPKVTFSFTGYNPWMITRMMNDKQAQIVPGMNIADYHAFTAKTNPSTQIVPLCDHKFNRCKSNIAWIEGTLFGAVCIAPDFEEWRVPGCLTYRDEKDFKASLEFSLKEQSKCANYHAMSMDFIKETLLLSKVNVMRDRLIDSMFNIANGRKPEWPKGGERQDDPVMVLE